MGLPTLLAPKPTVLRRSPTDRFNVWCTGYGYGFEVRTQSVQTRHGNLMYSDRVSEAATTSRFAFATWEAFNQFGEWMMDYYYALSEGSAGYMSMTIVDPASPRRWGTTPLGHTGTKVVNGIPYMGPWWGDDTATLTYQCNMTWEITEDAVLTDTGLQNVLTQLGLASVTFGHVNQDHRQVYQYPTGYLLGRGNNAENVLYDDPSPNTGISVVDPNVVIEQQGEQ